MILAIIWGSSFILMKKDSSSPLEITLYKFSLFLLCLFLFALKIYSLTKRLFIISLTGIVGSAIPIFIY